MNLVKAYNDTRVGGIERLNRLSFVQKYSLS